jgi:O-antigen biosynthesis protein
MIEIKNNKLIVVLGMHRSGTSAITRGLQVMGVELGVKLMPPIEGSNPKGFWEDLDLNALNIEMLNAIGNDWYYLSSITVQDIKTLHEQGYFHRAVELMSQKTDNTSIFGFKDPRVSKLLPFWKEVFNYCQFDVNYVIALRHPLSVASSLAKRDGVEIEQSYFLWLSHIITSLTNSTGVNRVLVDYDRLMQSPDRELRRVAKSTGLEIDPIELERYKNDFLEQGLRHTVYDVNDLVNDSCPATVREVYFSLLDVASDKAGFDSLEGKILLWSNEFEYFSIPLLLIDRLFTQKIAIMQTLAERNWEIANLNQTIAVRENDISNLWQAVGERDTQIARRDGDITNLWQAVGERDNQITTRDEDIANLRQAVVERAKKIRALRESWSFRSGYFLLHPWKIPQIIVSKLIGRAL